MWPYGKRVSKIIIRLQMDLPRRCSCSTSRLECSRARGAPLRRTCSCKPDEERRRMSAERREHTPRAAVVRRKAGEASASACATRALRVGACTGDVTRLATPVALCAGAASASEGTTAADGSAAAVAARVVGAVARLEKGKKIGDRRFSTPKPNFTHDVTLLAA